MWLEYGLFVLLSSRIERNARFSQTWLLEFNLDGAPTDKPLKLEHAWGAYRDGKNWEALDWVLDGARLILSLHADRDDHIFTVFPLSLG